MHAETTRQMPVKREIPGLPCKGAIRREQAAAAISTEAAIMLKAANPKPVWSCAGNAMAPLEYTVSVHTRKSPMPVKAKGISMKRSLKPANRFAFMSYSPSLRSIPRQTLYAGIIALQCGGRRPDPPISPLHMSQGGYLLPNIPLLPSTKEDYEARRYLYGFSENGDAALMCGHRLKQRERERPASETSTGRTSRKDRTWNRAFHDATS